MTVNTSLFVVSPTLQDYLVDKDTGAPLSAGIVTFYQDAARSILKNVYEQTGTPGSYTYNAIANPMTLSSVGTFEDGSGNDIIPYFYPYDETLTVPTEQLYYVTVYNSDGVLQFTRSGFPYPVITGSGPSPSGDETLLNFMPNPQMTAHYNLANSGAFTANSPVLTPNAQPAGVATEVVATGGSCGWYYARPSASTDNDTITFQTLSTATAGITGNPRYAVRCACLTPTGSDAYKELRVRFDNVNRFSTSGGTQFYTLAMTGTSNTAGPLTVNMQVRLFFGTGGASPAEYSLPAVTFNNGVTYQQVSETVGPNNDDYMEICLQFPVVTAYDVSLTDFILTPGENVEITSFPERPYNIDFATGVAGSIPTPKTDGSNLYLPIIYTPTGFGYDTSTIGNIYASLSATAPTGYLNADGSGYLTSAYSNNIPLTRIQSFLWNGGTYNNIPQFGTGPQYFTDYISSTTAAGGFYLSTNNFGAATAPAAGTSGFTVTAQWAANTFTPYYRASVGGATGGLSGGATLQVNMTMYNSSAGITGPSVSGMPTNWKGLISYNYPNAQPFFLVYPTSGAVGGSDFANPSNPGYYFTFVATVNPTTPTTATYYVWFQVTNESDPMPVGYTQGIKVVVKTTDNMTDVMYKIAVAMQGGYMSYIAATVPTALAGKNFTFSTSTTNYYVWFQLNGVGTDPHVAGATGILVNLASTVTTAAQVAAAIQQILNQYSFGVPQLQGLFLRGYDPNGVWDPNYYNRSSMFNNAIGSAYPGTFETDTIQAHTHLYNLPATSGGATDWQSGSGTAWTIHNNFNATTSVTGNIETRPRNFSVNWIIKI